MEETTAKGKSGVDDAVVYNVLSSLVIHSENIRWIRLNSLIIFNSVLIVAWAAVFSSRADLDNNSVLLTIICVPGIVLGLIWSFLGYRSSGYLDDYHSKAERIETTFGEDMEKPFHVSEARRQTVRTGLMKITSSLFIVTALPILFSLFFGVLIFHSW